MSAYYNFVLYRWINKGFNETDIQTLVTRGIITQTEADTILATPQL